jgi:hypothetical protein
MDNDENIQKLEKKLEEMKSLHKSLWEIHGSELCAGDMLRKEKELEDKISKLKITNKWEKLGLLEGLNGFDQTISKLFESKLSHLINENEDISNTNTE